MSDKDAEISRLSKRAEECDIYESMLLTLAEICGCLDAGIVEGTSNVIDPKKYGPAIQRHIIALSGGQK